MFITQHTVTPETDLSKYYEPSEPLPRTGDIFRWCKDSDISKRFYLVAQVKTPPTPLSRANFLPLEALSQLDFQINCITFVWDEKTNSFSIFDPIHFEERWFRSGLNDDYTQKFVPVGHASDFSPDSAMGFLIPKWVEKDSMETWMFHLEMLENSN